MIRRPSGAGSSRRSDLIRNSRNAGLFLSNSGPSTQSSNQSPPERGTEFSDAETGAQTDPFCLPEVLLETRRVSQSPHSSAMNAAILARAPTQRLGGGVRNHARTGLARFSPENTEFFVTAASGPAAAPILAIAGGSCVHSLGPNTVKRVKEGTDSRGDAA